MHIGMHGMVRAEGYRGGDDLRECAGSEKLALLAISGTSVTVIVAWYGMIWHGMVMVWYGVLWHGTAWYSLVWYAITVYGMT